MEEAVNKTAIEGYPLYGVTLVVHGGSTTVVLLLVLILSCVCLCGVYFACVSQALKGKLDLVYDEETGRPMHPMRLMNPFKRKRDN